MYVCSCIERWSNHITQTFPDLLFMGKRCQNQACVRNTKNNTPSILDFGTFRIFTAIQLCIFCCCIHIFKRWYLIEYLCLELTHHGSLIGYDFVSLCEILIRLQLIEATPLFSGCRPVIVIDKSNKTTIRQIERLRLQSLLIW